MVENWGIGRKDYSASTEVSVIPVVSSHEGRMYIFGYAAALPGHIAVLGLHYPVTDQNYVWKDFSIQIDSNELILLGLVHNYGKPSVAYRALKMGYGKVDLEFPQGLRVSPPDNLVIYLGNYTTSIRYIYVYAHGFSEGLPW